MYKCETDYFRRLKYGFKKCVTKIYVIFVKHVSEI